jgi:MoxR-like ATPase
MKIKMGYPVREEEQYILKHLETAGMVEAIDAVCTAEEIAAMQKEYSAVHVDDDISSYILDIVEATRKNENISLGASPRGSMALYRASQAYAYINGRSFVKPDDVIYLAPFILSHRLIIQGLQKFKRAEPYAVVKEILSGITPPVEKG